MGNNKDKGAGTLKHKLIITLFLISIVFTTGCIGDQVKEIVENNIEAINDTVQVSAYDPYVTFGKGYDPQTGALYGQSQTNTFSVSSIQNIYASLSILASNSSTFSFKYEIKLNGASNKITEGTVTGNISSSPYYVLVALPVSTYGAGTYTIDFFESSDTVKAVASGSCTVQ